MDQIMSAFEEIFNEEICNQLAIHHRFVQRTSSRLKGHEFVKALILPRQGLHEESLGLLVKQLRKFNPEANISSQALAKRTNCQASSSLMKAVFVRILQKSRQKVMATFSNMEATLSPFPKVLIEDSTVIRLHEKLQNRFKGTNRGGTAGRAQLKIDLIHEVKHDQIIEASIHSGNKPDQGLSSKILDHVRPGDLVIRDLGYYSLVVFQKIIEKGGYFLSRLKASSKVFNEDMELLDLGKYFHKHHRFSNTIEMKIYLGEAKVECRLVAYRQSKEVTDKRLRSLHKNARSKGETLSRARKTLAQFSIFITNVPEELLEPKLIGTIYRLRWEIELIFKRWKSLLKMHILTGINPHRIECLIWARLCSVFLLSIIQSTFWRYSHDMCDKELSITKLMRYLINDNCLFTAVVHCELEKMFETMLKDLSRILCKDKRRRRTMRERVSLKEGFYEDAA